MKKIMMAVLTFVFITSAAMAGKLSPVSSEKTDQSLWGTGAAAWIGQKESRIGYDTTNNMGGAYIAVFKLPVLPDGETISSATLSVNVLKPQGVFGGEPDWNIDVYGVRASTSSKVLPTDFFEGDNDTNATRVVDNFISVKGTVPAATGPCDSGKSAEFGAWLQKLYTGNTPNQPYVFIRLNSDVPYAGYKHIKNPAIQVTSRYLQIGTGDNETAGACPTLTITTGSK